MINNVKRPSFLSVVPQPKKLENDPGSSQGSGNFYEGAPQAGQSPDQKSSQPSDASSDEKEKSPGLAVVARTEQMGMTEVVKDLLELKKNDPHVNPGLSTRYTSDSQNAKGLLLNKKAE